jgi:hypothetical protein
MQCWWIFDSETDYRYQFSKIFFSKSKSYNYDYTYLVVYDMLDNGEMKHYFTAEVYL